MSQITTHILDTSCGKPAGGVQVILYSGGNDAWAEVTRGITNEDGRITDLLENDVFLDAGMYRLRFETKDYFRKGGTDTFYPYVDVVFNVQSHQHYHVPLLLNPFGYSTYRGS